MSLFTIPPIHPLLEQVAEDLAPVYETSAPGVLHDLNMGALLPSLPLADREEIGATIARELAWNEVGQEQEPSHEFALKIAVLMGETIRAKVDCGEDRGQEEEATVEHFATLYSLTGEELEALLPLARLIAMLPKMRPRRAEWAYL